MLASVSTRSPQREAHHARSGAGRRVSAGHSSAEAWQSSLQGGRRRDQGSLRSNCTPHLACDGSHLLVYFDLYINQEELTIYRKCKYFMI